MPTAQLNTNGIGSLTSGDVTSEQLDAIRERIGPLEGLGSLVTPFKVPQNFQDGGSVTDEEINKALGPTVTGSFATGRSSGFLGGVADELAARTAGGTRTAFGQGSHYTEGTYSGRFLSAKDIAYKEPGSVAEFYGVTTDNIFSEGQHLSRFQREAVQKGVTSGGNAGILADLRSNKNVLGNNPAQAALLRQYLDTGVVPAGLDAQFAINAYDYAIREQGRKQQNKPPSFLQSALGVIKPIVQVAAVIPSPFQPYAIAANVAIEAGEGDELGAALAALPGLGYLGQGPSQFYQAIEPAVDIARGVRAASEGYSDDDGGRPLGEEAYEGLGGKPVLYEELAGDVAAPIDRSDPAPSDTTQDGDLYSRLIRAYLESLTQGGDQIDRRDMPPPEQQEQFGLPITFPPLVEGQDRPFGDAEQTPEEGFNPFTAFLGLFPGGGGGGGDGGINLNIAPSEIPAESYSPTYHGANYEHTPQPMFVQEMPGRFPHNPFGNYSLQSNYSNPFLGRV